MAAVNANSANAAALGRRLETRNIRWSSARRDWLLYRRSENHVGTSWPLLRRATRPRGYLSPQGALKPLPSDGRPISRLDGKVAVITGGAAGIGEATARLFCQHGAKVIIADIQDDLGLSVSHALGPDSAAYIHCDVTVEADVQNAVDYAVERFGRLDIMFNNAGVLDPQKPLIEGVEGSEFERVMSVNVTGVFFGTKHAARVMGTGGSVINNGSVAAVIGGVASHAYVASKHAVVGLTRSAAAELGRRGIRVNCVSPFAVASSLAAGFSGWDARELEEFIGGLSNLKAAPLRVEDVAEAALFLAGEESKHVSGHNLVVDGGFSVVNNAFGLFNGLLLSDRVPKA